MCSATIDAWPFRWPVLTTAMLSGSPEHAPAVHGLPVTPQGAGDAKRPVAQTGSQLKMSALRSSG